ncbi:MAG: hypothetical protein HY720_33230 [Planctomycetes bacterium]|nr:hypothetical protein [Planctomycetota bacterium]
MVGLDARASGVGRRAPEGPERASPTPDEDGDREGSLRRPESLDAFRPVEEEREAGREAPLREESRELGLLSEIPEGGLSPGAAARRSCGSRSRRVFSADPSTGPSWYSRDPDEGLFEDGRASKRVGAFEASSSGASSYSA